MVLHAYIDDSDSHDPAVRKAYVLGGYLATPAAWAKFSAEWEPALEAFNISRGPSGRRRFKMSEMARGRMEDVAPFWEIIARHTMGAVCVVIYEDDLERAKSRIWSDNTEIIFSPPDEGRNLIKRVLIEHLNVIMADPLALHSSEGNQRFSKLLAENRDKVEFYFDIDGSEAWILDWWEEFVGSLQIADREIYGSQPPQFVNDEEYLPVQAADFWAWWARRAYEIGNFQELASGNFGTWKGSESPPFLVFRTSEDALTNYFMEALSKYPWSYAINIYDAKIKPRTEHALHVEHAKNRSQLVSNLKLLLKRLRGR